jgi:hypothetical protein
MLLKTRRFIERAGKIARFVGAALEICAVQYL